MKITVTNFGPVKKASLEIAPLTIIIGRNNLGKSFLSQLIFCVTSSLSSRLAMRFLELPYYPHAFANLGLLDIPTNYLAEDIIQGDGEIRNTARSLRQGELSREKAIQLIAERCCSRLATDLGEILTDQLVRTFGVRIGDLVRLGANRSTISIWTSQLSHFLITFGHSGKLSANLKLDASEVFASLCRNQHLLSSLESVRTTARIRRQIQILLETIEPILFSEFKILRSFYLPAGRGGLMDSWETISSAWVNLAPVSIPRGITMPPLPGTSAMFYNILQSLGGKQRGEFYHTRDRFMQILGGDLDISIDQALKGKRNIEYVLKANGRTMKINIIHAASMVKELGPLYLIIREVLRPGDLFIVEEPESHLHPTAQRDFMRVMMELTEKGVYTLFTTHSDLLLRSIGHFVYESSRKQGMPLNSLSVNLIKEVKGGGSISKNIRLSRKGAIPTLPTFDEVTDELYDEELRLDRD